MEDKNSPKIANKFVCKKCDYKCCKQSDYDKHLLTAKHKKDDAEDILEDEKLAVLYFCECGKEYKHRQGLWKHKKTCQNSKANVDTDILVENNKSEQSNKDNLIEYLIKENSEFKSLIMELINTERRVFRPPKCPLRHPFCVLL